MTSSAARPLDVQPVDRVIARYARCADPRGAYSTLFFSVHPVDIAKAKAVCARCTVRELCLQRAIERGEPAGVWGGECVEGGIVVAAPRRRGRPPSGGHPTIVDEVTGRTDIAAQHRATGRRARSRRSLPEA